MGALEFVEADSWLGKKVSVAMEKGCVVPHPLQASANVRSSPSPTSLSLA